MYLERFSLKGKVALVSGGSQGIGREIALGFAEAGADLVIGGLPGPDLARVQAETSQGGSAVITVGGDVANPEARHALVTSAMERFGKIDVLFNNAGVNTVYGSVFKTTEEAWDRIMDVNLKACFFLSLAIAQIMRRQGGGSIINMASAAGIQVLPKAAAYGISKAGVIMLTRTLAEDLGRYNIRVNALAPHWVQTPGTKFMWNRPEELQKAIAQTALGRIGQPEDVVGAALLLASEAGRHITGATMVIDGGFFPQ